MKILRISSFSVPVIKPILLPRTISYDIIQKHPAFVLACVENNLRAVGIDCSGAVRLDIIFFLKQKKGILNMVDV